MAMELNTSHTQLEGMPLENSSPTPGWGRQHGAGEVARAPQGCHREPPHRPWPPAELPSTSAALDQSFSFLASSWSQSCSPSLPAWMLSPLTGTQHYPSPSSPLETLPFFMGGIDLIPPFLRITRFSTGRHFFSHVVSRTELKTKMFQISTLLRSCLQ